MKNIKSLTLILLLSIGIPVETLGQNISGQEASEQKTSVHLGHADKKHTDNATTVKQVEIAKIVATTKEGAKTVAATAEETKSATATTKKGTKAIAMTEEGAKEAVAETTTAADSIFSMPAPIPLASTMQRPFLMYGITPFAYDGYANWDLHKGFNASIGMNISVGFGKNRLHGVGFGQDAAFLYALPLNNRLSVAGGVYATNMDWGNYTYRNVGITGIASFKATDRITIYAYGNKSFMPKRLYPAYPLPNFTPDKFGGMVNFKVGESASFSIGVEAIKNDHPYGYFW